MFARTPQTQCWVNAKDEDQQTPLHYAAEYGRRECLQELIKHNADVNAKHKYQWTPLHYAAAYDKRECLQELLKHNADVNAKDEDQQTPLHYAAAYDKRECLQELLKHNADVNAKDEVQCTPLHVAAEHGKRECFKELMKSKAHLNIKTNRGTYALDMVLKKTLFDLKELLIERCETRRLHRSVCVAIDNKNWEDVQEVLNEDEIVMKLFCLKLFVKQTYKYTVKESLYK